MILTITLTLLTVSFVIFAGYTFFTIRYRNGIKDAKLKEIPRQAMPMVSILTPLRKLDDELEINLESCFRLDYPSFEILYAVDSMDDPIVDILVSLKARYPHVPCKILETGHCTTENPKVNKLVSMAGIAAGAMYWVIDSNVRVEKNTLKKLVHEYVYKDSKIIFSPVRASGSRSIGSIIENSYFNFFLSGSVISAWKMFKQQIVIGKSILIEKNTLKLFGGFSYFKDYLAEDYMMGETYIQSKIPISSNFTWVTTISQTSTIKSFFSRMERWAKLRFHLKFHFYLGELLLHPIMLALVFGSVIGGKKGIAVFGSAVGLKILLEFLNFLALNKEDRKKIRVILLMPFCILTKDILLFIAYFSPFFSSTVNWRDGKIRIGKDTLIALSNETLLLDGA